MTPDQARAEIRSAMRVTPALVAQAKEWVLEAGGGRAGDLIRGFESSIALLPQPIVVHPTASTVDMIRDAAAALSARAAAAEAIASLMASGVLLMASASYEQVSFDVQYTTVVPGSGGESGRWRFDDLNCHVPTTVAIAPSYRFGRDLVLADSDLFLRTLDIEDVHPLVEEALREAVLCFRRDLFTPCLAMLTKAIEGTFTELGLSLANCLEPERRAEVLGKLTDPRRGLLALLEDVQSLWQLPELKHVVRDSQLRMAQLDDAARWSREVRDARNVVHFDHMTVVPNTFEKVSVLMLAAVTHLRSLYQLRDAARAAGGNASTNSG